MLKNVIRVSYFMCKKFIIVTDVRHILHCAHAALIVIKF